jgi:hypothetical protein
VYLCWSRSGNILLSDFVAKKLERKGAVRETPEEIRQVNVHLRLRFYQVLTSWRTTKLQATRVSVAYIDDKTHWTTLYALPTERIEAGKNWSPIMLSYLTAGGGSEWERGEVTQTLATQSKKTGMITRGFLISYLRRTDIGR